MKLKKIKIIYMILIFGHGNSVAQICHTFSIKYETKVKFVLICYFEMELNKPILIRYCYLKYIYERSIALSTDFCCNFLLFEAGLGTSFDWIVTVRYYLWRRCI